MKDDDDLLKGLARAAREEDAADVRLRALAAGTLSPEERAELEALARRDAETARAVELYRPFDGAELDRMSAKIAPPRVASRRLGRVVVLFAAPVAAAAAVLLLARTRSTDLPPYEIGFAANVQSSRANGPSEPLPEVRLHRGATFEMIVRPATPASAEVAARAALVRDGHARPWNPPIEVSPEGTVHILGSATALFGDASGEYDVVVAVARPGDLPSEAELVAIAEGGAAQPAQARVVRGRVTFVE